MPGTKVMGRRSLINKTWSLALLPILISAVFAQSGQSNQDQSTGNDETIKISSTLVNVPIVASDSQGRYIPNLHAEDFILYEDGIKQEVGFFSTETVPFHVVLLLDVSSSTRNYLYAIQAAAREFIENLRPNDQVMVISFGSNITVHNSFASDKDVLKKAIRSTTSGGGTRLYDALLFAARSKLKPVEGRKALIVLTDGDDTGSYMHAKYAISETLESDALVYVVRYPESGSTLQHQQGSRFLIPSRFSAQYPYPYPYDFLGEFVSKTGGTLYDAKTINNISSLMRNIAEELRHVYTISYYPLNPVQNGGYRKIELKLRNDPTLVLHFKKGYYAK